jgi:probable rRNA maturation factor
MSHLRLSEEAAAPDLLANRYRIQVVNESDVAVDVDQVSEAARRALASCDSPAGEVSIAIVGDEAMHRLNRQYLEHDYPTDVLSFALSSVGAPLEGEIIVSVDTARRAALEAGWPAEHELLLYVVHGALHLAGHDDKGAEESAAMRAAEAAVLAQLGVSPSPNDDRWGVQEVEGR